MQAYLTPVMGVAPKRRRATWLNYSNRWTNSKVASVSLRKQLPSSVEELNKNVQGGLTVRRLSRLTV